jgi:hypothetical protein
MNRSIILVCAVFSAISYGYAQQMQTNENIEKRINQKLNEKPL